MALQLKTSSDYVTLMASAVKTVTGTSTAVRMPGMVNAFVFTMDLTNAATEVDDTLDVAVQTKVDGTNWVDVAHFTRILGNGDNTQRYGMKVTAGGSQAIYTATTALAAGNAVRNLIGDEWRVRWTIVDNGADNATFTLRVTACPM